MTAYVGEVTVAAGTRLIRISEGMVSSAFLQQTLAVDETHVVGAPCERYRVWGPPPRSLVKPFSGEEDGPVFPASHSRPRPLPLAKVG